MRTFRILEHISLDGVIQAPGGPKEDGDYEYGGWIVPFSDHAVGEAILAAHGARFDLLLGRRTYDIWAHYWPAVRGSVIGDSFNAATKYVATHRPGSLGWGPAVSVGENLVEQIRSIRAGDGVDVIVWGSSTVAPVLLEHGLADEVVLLVYPVLLGKGKRLFSGDYGARGLSLVSTKAAASGVLINTYRPTGPLRTGSFSAPPR